MSGLMPLFLRIISIHQPGKSTEPGNQLAGIDLGGRYLMPPLLYMDKWLEMMKINFTKRFDVSVWYRMVEKNPECFYSFVAEYSDLTTYWWTGDPRTRNISYGHGRYQDGYRYRGRQSGIEQTKILRF